MDFSQLKQSLSKPNKIYLLEGPEAFFRTRGVNMIKKAFLTEPDFNLTLIEGSELKKDISKLVDVLPVYPFLGEYRVIVINEWYPTINDFKNKELKEFFSTELDCTIVIVNNQNKSELLKKQPSVTLIDCKKADLPLITLFLQGEAKKNNLKISSSTCQTIAEFCLYDMTKINSEMQKLVSFCYGQTEITKDVVTELVNKEIDYKIYEVVNFIVEKKTDKAFQTLKEMIDNGESQVLLVSLFYHFRRLLYVTLSKSPNNVIAEELGCKEYAVKIAKEQAKSFTSKQILKINEKLIEYDAGFKSGKYSLDQALNNAVFMILST